MSASSDPQARHSLSGVAVVVAASLIALVCVLPIGVVLVQVAAAGWADALRFLLRPRIAELLGNTVLLLLLTVPLTIVLGVGVAWLVERTRLPGAAAWRVAMIAPLAVPSFVSSYAWSSVLPSLHGALGAVMITTLAYFPFVFLPVAALLRTLDHADLEVARTLGAGPWSAAARVLLPQLRPAICGGALLVALHLLAEFGVLEMMRFPTFTTAILQQYAVGYSTTSGNLLAVLLIGLCGLVLLLELTLRGRRRIARLGSGAHTMAPKLGLGGWTVPAVAAATLLTTVAVVVPVAVVVRWLIPAVAGDRVDAPGLVAATATTLLLAVAAGVVTMGGAAPAAWLAQRGGPGLRRWAAVAVERATFLASALPGVVVGLALVTLAVQWVRPAYQTLGLLVVAYLILFVPRAMVSWRSGLAATPPELAETARALGSGPATALRRVVAPMVAPSAGAGFVLVFLAVTSELTATLLLSPTGTRTLATAFWAASDELDYVGSAPYAAMMIMLSAPLTLLLRRQIVRPDERDR